MSFQELEKGDSALGRSRSLWVSVMADASWDGKKRL